MRFVGITAAGLVAASIVVGGGHRASAHEIIVKDGTFRHWTFGSSGSGKGGGVMTVTKTIGDPKPALLNAITTASGESGLGFGFDNRSTTSLPLEGSKFTLRITFKSGSGAVGNGQGQGICLIVVQGSNIYETAILGYTSVSSAWKRLAFTGTISSNNFLRISGTGPAVPDFSSGIPTKFGIGGFHYHRFVIGGSEETTMSNFYDSFVLIIS